MAIVWFYEWEKNDVQIFAIKINKMYNQFNWGQGKYKIFENIMDMVDEGWSKAFWYKYVIDINAWMVREWRHIFNVSFKYWS